MMELRSPQGLTGRGITDCWQGRRHFAGTLRSILRGLKVMVLPLVLAISFHTPSVTGLMSSPQKNSPAPGKESASDQGWTNAAGVSASSAVEAPSLRIFDPRDIHILMNPDVDIVYHTLAYFSLPGDPSNLYSPEYMQQIKKAKQNLETGESKLDQQAAELAASYRQMPRLRFLNLAPFMADDYASFKQALTSIDYNFQTQENDDPRLSPEERKAKNGNTPVLFGNSRRLIPLLKNRFPDPEEHHFLKQFADCMDDERTQFYKNYREVRSELDQQEYEKFLKFWNAEGLKILSPWARRSNVNVFNIYLSPVMKRNGRGIPVNQDRQVLWNVVAPLPETSLQAVQSLLIVLHETTRRSTDLVAEPLVGSKPDAPPSVVYENAAFYANHLYLKKSFPTYSQVYLKFFLNLDDSSMTAAQLESEFLKSYPLSGALKTQIELLVQNL
ncbi:MAG: hypothetical protein U0V70_14160 [Terriglobia bacterium]